MNNLITIKTKQKRRVGRGISGKGGKTAGRGTKGQKSRAGHNIPNRFEGGQTPITMRLSKFKGISKKKSIVTILNIDKLCEKFKDNAEITIDSLIKNKFIDKNTKNIKIIGTTDKAKKFAISKEIKYSKNVAKHLISMPSTVKK